MSKISHLPPSDTFTPEQALLSALAFTEEGTADELKDVLIIGYTADGELIIRSSRMDVKYALWFSEQLRLYALGML